MTGKPWIRRVLLLGGTLLLLEVALRLLPVPALAPPVVSAPLEPYLMFGTLPLDPAYRSLGLEQDRPALMKPLPPKPPGEIRIVVLGGSVAYGTGAGSREACWDRRLERLLMDARPAGDVRAFRVLNLARPSYNTAQCLISLGLEGLEDDPDCVVLLDGFNDLAVPLLYGGRPGDPYYFEALKAQAAAEGSWGRLWRELSWHSRILQAAAALRAPSRFPGRPLESEATAEVRRIAVRNLRLMADLLRARKVPGFLVAEPIVTQKPMSEAERRGLESRAWGELLAREYPPHAQALLAGAAEAGWISLDATDLFAGVAETRFLDSVHLLDAGQEALARRVAEALKPTLGLGPR